MEKKFRIMLFILLVVIATQLIGCSFINANVIGEIVDEGKVTMANVINEKKSFTQKVYDIIFGEEPEQPEIKWYIKDHTMPKELKHQFILNYFVYHRAFEYDRCQYAINLNNAANDGLITLENEFQFLTFFADVASYVDVKDIMDGRFPSLKSNYQGLPVYVEGTYMGYDEYDIDEVFLTVRAPNFITYHLMVPYYEGLEEYEAGDTIVAYGTFIETYYVDDNSSGYTKQVPGGALIQSQLFYNLDIDIIEDYKLTKDEEEFYYTSYSFIEEAPVMNPETGEMEIKYDITAGTLTPTTFSNVPYTVKSITKIGPYIDILIRTNGAVYDYDLYDRIRLSPDGTMEYSYSYLSDNHSMSKETPADYFSLGWRKAKIAWMQ